MPNDNLLTEKEVADLLGYSTKRLQAARISGEMGLPFIQLSPRAIQYRKSDVDTWIDYTNRSARRRNTRRRRRWQDDPPPSRSRTRLLRLCP
jgi:predicted DNA-binding transcriptional regulator AlpA